MDNEKLNNEEELETSEEVTEEAVEATPEDTAEDAAEVIAEDAIEETAEETVAESDEETIDETVEIIDGEAVKVTADIPSKNPMSKVVAIAVAAVAVIAVVVLIVVNPFAKKDIDAMREAYKDTLKIKVVKNNPYEKDYIDTTGEMIGEIADKAGYSCDEYKEMFGLPKDMPASTNSNAAQSYIPVRILIKQYGMTIEEFREEYGLGDNITEDSTFGEVTGEMTLENMFGLSKLTDEEKSEQLAKIKETYGLGDDVTIQTKYKDVRKTIDEYIKKQREQSEEAKKQEQEKKQEEEKKQEDEQEDVQHSEDEDEAALQRAMKKAQDEGRLTGDSEKDAEVISEILAEESDSE